MRTKGKKIKKQGIRGVQERYGVTLINRRTMRHIGQYRERERWLFHKVPEKPVGIKENIRNAKTFRIENLADTIFYSM